MDDVTILSHQISIDPLIKCLIPGTLAFGRRHKSFLAYEVGLEDNSMSNYVQPSRHTCLIIWRIPVTFILTSSRKKENDNPRA